MSTTWALEDEGTRTCRRGLRGAALRDTKMVTFIAVVGAPMSENSSKKSSPFFPLLRSCVFTSHIIILVVVVARLWHPLNAVKFLLIFFFIPSPPPLFFFKIQSSVRCVVKIFLIFLLKDGCCFKKEGISKRNKLLTTKIEKNLLFLGHYLVSLILVVQVQFPRCFLCIVDRK